MGVTAPHDEEGVPTQSKVFKVSGFWMKVSKASALLPTAFKLILILPVIFVNRNTGQNSRRLLSMADGAGPYPFGFGDDDACAICMNRLQPPNERNYLVRPWRDFNVTTSSLYFPECHGFQFCEPCISRVCGDLSEVRGKCPICRRPTRSLHINTVRRPSPPVDFEQLYHSYIIRLQRADNSTLKYLKICTIHHPVRHCIRNQYYVFLKYFCFRPIFEERWLNRVHPRGCCEEYTNLLLSKQVCCVLDAFALITFVSGNVATGCCCVFDCFCASFCRDFCLCEPPME